MRIKAIFNFFKVVLKIKKEVVITQVNTPQEIIEKLQLNGLSAHNKYRGLHGVNDLLLDIELNKIAQAYSVILSEKAFEHSTNTNKYGENLYYICHCDMIPLDLNRKIKQKKKYQRLLFSKFYFIIRFNEFSESSLVRGDQ